MTIDPEKQKEYDAIRVIELSRELARLNERKSEIEREMERIWRRQDYKLFWEKREQTVTYVSRANISNKGKLCACGAPAKAKGMCPSCYQRSRKAAENPNYVPMEKPEHPTGSPCTVPGCEGAIVGKGLCMKHFKRERRKLHRGEGE